MPSTAKSSAVAAAFAGGGLPFEGLLATMFCKRVAAKIKRAKAELEEIRLREQEIVEALIENYRARGPLDRGQPCPPTRQHSPQAPSEPANDDEITP